MEIKELLKSLGAPDDLLTKAEKGEATIDDIKSFHSKSFINRDLAIHDDEVKKHFTGAFSNRFTSEIKKNFGIEAEKGEAWEDVVKKASATISEKQKTLEAEIKKAKEAGSDEKFQTLSKELERYKTDKAEFEKQNGILKSQVDETKAEYEKRIKDIQIENDLNGIMSQLNFITDRSNIEKRGFDAVLREQLKFDYEKENEDSEPKLVVRQSDGKPFVIDSQPVYDPKKAIEYLASKEGQLAKNDGGKAKIYSQTPASQGQQNGNGKANRIKSLDMVAQLEAAASASKR